MIGVIANVMAVVIGGILGTVFGKKLSTRFATELNKVFGVCAMGLPATWVSVSAAAVR